MDYQKLIQNRPSYTNDNSIENSMIIADNGPINDTIMEESKEAPNSNMMSHQIRENNFVRKSLTNVVSYDKKALALFRRMHVSIFWTFWYYL